MRKSKRRPSVADHRDFKAAAAHVIRLSKRRKKIPVLFLLDPVLSFEAAGIDVSPAMKRHIRHVAGGAKHRPSLRWHLANEGLASIKWVTGVRFVNRRKGRKIPHLPVRGRK